MRVLSMIGHQITSPGRMAVFVFTSAMLFSSCCAAAGALAVGVPSDVARDGFAFGVATNQTGDAGQVALEQCRGHGGGVSANLASLCTLVSTFRDKCASISMDPQAGTPGVGWAIARRKQDAEGQALSNCEATAGPTRRNECEITMTRCDGSAN